MRAAQRAASILLRRQHKECWLAEKAWAQADRLVQRSKEHSFLFFPICGRQDCSTVERGSRENVAQCCGKGFPHSHFARSRHRTALDDTERQRERPSEPS